jgi:5-methylcytosine-specific restriction protein B
MRLKHLTNEIEVWSEWKNNYVKNVPQFILEASSKINWQDWDKNVFREFFEKSNDQCVSSLRQGYFDSHEQAQIKNNWHELAPLLKLIADSQNSPLFDVYEEIKKVISKYTSNDKRAATNRLIAGLQPELLCTIVKEEKLDHLVGFLNDNVDGFKNIGNNWFRKSNHLLNFYKKQLSKSGYDIVTLPWQTYDIISNTQFNLKDMQLKASLLEKKDILLYKKQIILQGPPGTGKTKQAKELAQELILQKVNITTLDILKYIIQGINIKSTGEKKNYFIESIDVGSEKIEIKRESETTDKTSFEEIKKAYKDKLWQQKIDQNAPRRAASLAKYIFDKKTNFKNTDQYKLIQLHPSYTYEDFVRGIVAKPTESGENILYEAEDKLLGNFAKDALKNYLASKGESIVDLSFQGKLNALLEEISETIDKGETFIFDKKSTAHIIAIKEDGLLYSFPQRDEIKYKLLFSDMEKIYNFKDSIEKPIDLRDAEVELGLGMKGKYPYYYMTLQRLEKIKVEDIEVQREELKNFVLIIDEINRANLSSVLGELIYALEYRGEAVESMYAVSGDNELILPPNLYIIGTMNTADRSVGHIDYAIRRRFAFVEMLPENLGKSGMTEFDEPLFRKISELFISNYDGYYNSKELLKRAKTLSTEFRVEDVWLGHSYFINKENGGDIQTRLQYEIKPILMEYVKDGILIGKVTSDGVEITIEDYIQSL